MLSLQNACLVKFDVTSMNDFECSIRCKAIKIAVMIWGLNQWHIQLGFKKTIFSYSVFTVLAA